MNISGITFDLFNIFQVTKYVHIFNVCNGKLLLLVSYSYLSARVHISYMFYMMILS